MNRYIALFRGINVGGHHALPMRELATVLQQQGCVDVRTYIQSGNVVLNSPIADARALGRQLTAAVLDSHGFESQVLVLAASELRKAAAANPFPAADAEPKTLHLFFLDQAPKTPDLKSMDGLKTSTESYALKGKVFYLHTPDGFGHSKLAARVEKLLGVVTTARNWRTVTTLLEML